MFIPVKISAKSANLMFTECEPNYIKNVCHASCCQSSTSKTGTSIAVTREEQDKLRGLGVQVTEGLIQPRAGEKKCPFKSSESLCSLHNTENKPFGCVASPFILNANDTLIVRNRYKLLKCYKEREGSYKKLPAYKNFRFSLVTLFGAEEALRIISKLDKKSGDFYAAMPMESYIKLNELKGVRE